VMRVRRLAGRAVAPEVALLRDEVAGLWAMVSRLDGELVALGAERERLAGRVEILDADLDEARRLNVRLAELTDLVTEVVLPLHDREIDIERLRPHDVEPQ
jgi:hypothetical protein